MKRTSKMNKLLWPFGVIALTLTILTVSLPAPADAVTILSGVGTATIDGFKSPGEWDNAGTLDLTVGTTPAQMLVMNDTNDLYLGMAIESSSLVPHQGEFDKFSAGGKLEKSLEKTGGEGCQTRNMWSI